MFNGYEAETGDYVLEEGVDENGNDIIRFKYDGEGGVCDKIVIASGADDENNEADVIYDVEYKGS